MRIWNRDLGIRIVFAFAIVVVCGLTVLGQPAPGPARTVSIPAVKESKLKNGLTVAVIEKKSTPVVTVQLLVRSGAASEESKKAGLADVTAAMLTKGTRTRTAEQIAGQMEFLGASLDTGAGWNSSTVTMTVTSDKLDQAMAVMADVVLNPSFAQEELDLFKSQTADELKSNLTQPAFLSNYVASVRFFDEHPAGGTPDSIAALTRASLLEFYKDNYEPGNSVLILTGDVTAAKAHALATSLLGRWGGKSARKEIIAMMDEAPASTPSNTSDAKTTPQLLDKILVIDLPGAGQASVSYALAMGQGRVDYDNASKLSVQKGYYPALALNSLLGGGYSSRLNQEIRIKRGLSYGAGSSFAWRSDSANFTTRTQTKNPSAPEVAELVLAEIKRLGDENVADTDLIPRKSVLTGNFGRNLETTAGLAAALGDLYTFEIPTAELNRYMNQVNAVTGSQIRDYAKGNLVGGGIVIVGDYSIFKDDLAKRFPNTPIDVIKVDELNIESPTLRKSDLP